MSTMLLQLSPVGERDISVLRHSFAVGVARGHALGFIQLGYRLALVAALVAWAIRVGA